MVSISVIESFVGRMATMRPGVRPSDAFRAWSKGVSGEDPGRGEEPFCMTESHYLLTEVEDPTSNLTIDLTHLLPDSLSTHVFVYNLFP